MKGKTLYIISIIVIAMPWLFLLEAIPISYSQISTVAEVTIEGIMFIALFIVVILLRKELKRLKPAGAEAKEADHNSGVRSKKGGQESRVIPRILFVLASLTLFLIGLVLVLIAVSFSL